MKKTIITNCNDEFITVIPYNSDPTLPEQRIQVRKLCFWLDGVYTHSVSEESVNQFLKKADLLGATVLPDTELSCCFVWESELVQDDEELPVFQIIYTEQIIYSIDEKKIKYLIKVHKERMQF